jgi:hypothetical protein
LNELPERVMIRPKLLGKNVIDNGDRGAASIRRLGQSEAASPHEWYSHRRKIVGSDTIPRDIERKTFRCGRWFRIRRWTKPRSLYVARQGEHTERNGCRNHGALDTRRRIQLPV